MNEPTKFPVILPSGQKTKPYSHAKIKAAVEGGKLPLDASVESPDGAEVMPINDFCFGRTKKPSPPPPAPVRQPAPDGKQKMPYFLRRRGMPEAVKLGYKKLSRDEQKAFERDFKSRGKSTLTAYIAWFFLGWHYLYLGRVGMQFAFWFTGGFLVIGWLIDFFRVPGMITRYNEDVARRLFAEQRMMG